LTYASRNLWRHVVGLIVFEIRRPTSAC